MASRAFFGPLWAIMSYFELYKALTLSTCYYFSDLWKLRVRKMVQTYITQIFFFKWFVWPVFGHFFGGGLYLAIFLLLCRSKPFLNHSQSWLKKKHKRYEDKANWLHEKNPTQIFLKNKLAKIQLKLILNCF